MARFQSVEVSVMASNAGALYELGVYWSQFFREAERIARQGYPTSWARILAEIPDV